MKHQTAIEGFVCLEKIGGLKMISNIIMLIVTLVMLFVAYMSSHMISEKKAGKTLPLPWERGGFFRGNK